MPSVNPFTLPYVVYKEKGNLPASAGIYYVLDRFKYEILYIGRSKNLQNRWKNHHRNWDVGLLESIYDDRRITIAWETHPEIYLKEIERKRIQEFKPTMNWKNGEDTDRYLYQDDAWKDSPGFCRYIIQNMCEEVAAELPTHDLEYLKLQPRLLETFDYRHPLTNQLIHRYKYLEEYCLFYYSANAEKELVFAKCANEIYQLVNDDLRKIMQYAAPSWKFDCPYLSGTNAITALTFILSHLIDAGFKAINDVFHIHDYHTYFREEIDQPSTKTCFISMLRPIYQRLAHRKWETLCFLIISDLDEEDSFLPIPEHEEVE